MKRKQGMPEALSEEHFANLKRKAGLPVEPPVEKASLSNKKRKTAKGAAGAKKPEPAPKKSSAKKSNGKAKKLPEPKEDSEDEEMGDEFDLDQLEDDGSADEDASSGEKKKKIWSDDENDDSDDAAEDDSVFDSDDQEEGGKKGKFVFSDDEDESDAEEKLTAANIAGLSRRLDKKLAEDKAITETEMQESAMQTNIDGPKIFGDEDDEDDELADKSKSLLAPDLQLLRQRITDTIRVLDEFAKLAEDGRSRAEYTAQLLKDICAVSLSCTAYFPRYAVCSRNCANDGDESIVLRLQPLPGREALQPLHPARSLCLLRGQRDAPSRRHPNKHLANAPKRPRPGAHQPWRHARARGQVEQGWPADFRGQCSPGCYARVSCWSLHYPGGCVFLACHGAFTATVSITCVCSSSCVYLY